MERAITSPFKQRLASGAPLHGTFVKTPHPHVVEVLAMTGLDCLCLDAEHAPFDRRDLDACIMATRAGGMPVLGGVTRGLEIRLEFGL